VRTVPVSKGRMGVRLTRSGWVGIALALLSVSTIGSYECWLATRKFVPLDMPLTFAKGAVTTTEFDVNLAGRYWFRIDDGYYSHQDSIPGCAPNDLQDGIITRWTLSGPSGVIIDEVRDYFRWTHLIDLEQKGHYFVRVQVSSDPACLGQVHPRLRADRLGDEYGKYRLWIGWVCLVSLTAGIGLIVLTPSTTDVEHLEQNLRRMQLSPQSYFASARFRLVPRMGNLPPYGLIASLLLLFLTISMNFLLLPMMHPKGIYVRLVRPDTPRTDPWAAPLIVRIESKWTGAENTYRWFVNEKEIRQQDLSGELRKQLALRAKWTVYLEADSNCAYNVALDAVDVIHELHATPVLLTPKSKHELQRDHAK